MGKSIFMAMLGLFLLTQTASAGQQKYFYMYGVADGDGDGHLTTSLLLSLSQCQAGAKARATVNGDLVQGCTPGCNTGVSKTAWEFIQSADTDGDTDAVYQAIGIYLNQSDCNAGIADANAAGFTDISTVCVAAQAHLFCK